MDIWEVQVNSKPPTVELTFKARKEGLTGKGHDMQPRLNREIWELAE